MGYEKSTRNWWWSSNKGQHGRWHVRDISTVRKINIINNIRENLLKYYDGMNSGTIKNNIYVYLNSTCNCTGSRHRSRRGHKLKLPLILNFIGNYSLILLLGIKNKLLALIIIKSHQQIEQAKCWFQLNSIRTNNLIWIFIDERSLLAIAMALTVE